LITNKLFEDWLDGLGKAWVNKDPVAASNLCSKNVIYYEDPFLPPLTNRDQVKNMWSEVPNSQKNIKYSYEIISIIQNMCITEWSASFTRIPSNTPAKLKGIYLVKLDSDGLCEEFHQWWNTNS
jgi:hypothetical protein